MTAQPRERPRLFTPHVGPRREVQALRAIAVSAVVLYHLWPWMLPGGYAGVDIFFVISGFLITAHLVREADRTGRVNLPEFWARRARRLLPASLLVLAASALGTLLVVPTALWQQFLREIGASALYVLNWVLASDSVDYLAADNLASPVQHYWSLSAEEQFYLVWPLLVVLSFAIAARLARGRSHAVLAIVLGVVTAASLVYSIVLTATDPSPAYFVTPARAWEFGLGGLLALVPGRFAPREADAPERAPAIVSWLGLAAIVTTVVVYQPDTPFPGVAALLPALGTVAVIWAGTPRGFSPSRVFSLRPVQWLGDISYSLYLWHWPLVVLVPFAVLHELVRNEKLVLLAVAILLGWLTKIAVEDPARRMRWLVQSRARVTLGLTGAAMVVVIASTSFGYIQLENRFNAANDEATAIAAEQPTCFGANAYAPTSPDPCVNEKLTGRIFPDIAAGQRDGVLPDNMRCRSPSADFGLSKCEFGVPADEASLSIALIGDSHAEHWVPAVDRMADARSWHVDTYFKGGCPFSAVLRVEDLDKTDGACKWWNERVLIKLQKGDYDVVLTTQSTGHEFQKKPGETDMEAASRGLIEQWTKVEATTGARVVAIRDNPKMQFNPSVCLGRLGSDPVSMADDCVTPQSTALLPDPQIAAGAESGIPVLDFTDFYCRDDVCPAVVGSVIVYRDDNHLGGTFSRSLAPYLEEKLRAALED